MREPMHFQAEALERLREAESFLGSPINELFGDPAGTMRQRWLDSVRKILLANGIEPENLPGRWRTKFLAPERGTVLLEVALTLPLLLLLILGGVDLARMVEARTSVNYVAITTAQCVARTPAQCAAVETYAQTLATGVGLSGRNTTALSLGAGIVEVDYVWVPVSPFFKQATMKATATGVK